MLLERWPAFQFREKAPKDLVTEADVASQEAIRQVVLGRFPQHSFLAEEGERAAPSRLTLLCQSQSGYRNLARLVTRAYLEGQQRGVPRIERRWLSGAAALAADVLTGAPTVVPPAPSPGPAADDPSYGRVDGDITWVAGAGAVVAPRGPRPEAEMRLRYLETAGVFVAY